MRKHRDFQRAKVYAWEARTFPKFEEDFPLDYCKDLAAELYGSRVRVKDGRGRRSACAEWSRYPTIALPKFARNRIIIAHEVAHLLHRTDDTPWHGSHFMRTYIDLLDEMKLYRSDDLTQDARDFGLKVA